MIICGLLKLTNDSVIIQKDPTRQRKGRSNNPYEKE